MIKFAEKCPNFTSTHLFKYLFRLVGAFSKYGATSFYIDVDVKIVQDYILPCHLSSIWDSWAWYQLCTPGTSALTWNQYSRRYQVLHLLLLWWLGTRHIIIHCWSLQTTPTYDIQMNHLAAGGVVGARHLTLVVSAVPGTRVSDKAVNKPSRISQFNSAQRKPLLGPSPWYKHFLN